MYLCTIRDAHSRQIVGHVVADHARHDMVRQVIDTVVESRTRVPMGPHLTRTFKNVDEKSFTVPMDPNDVRGTMNQLLDGIDGAPNLSPTTAAYVAKVMIDGGAFSATVAQFAEAIKYTLANGALHPEAVEMSHEYSEQQLFDFVRCVSQELDIRQPWQSPLFTKINISEWPTFGQAKVIGSINRPADQLSAGVGLEFDKIPAGESSLPVILAHMRTGEDIAILGSTNPRSTTFSLLLRGIGDPVTALANLRELSRLRETDIVPVDG